MGSVLSYFLGYSDSDTVDSKVGLTKREKRLVRETWNIVRVHSVEAGVAIMASYFRRYPQYHQVFPAFKHVPVDELADNKKFQAHCQNIMSTLSNSIDALDDVDLMDAILHSTGERHGRRGQGLERSDDRSNEGHVEVEIFHRRGSRMEQNDRYSIFKNIRRHGTRRFLTSANQRLFNQHPRRYRYRSVRNRSLRCSSR